MRVYESVTFNARCASGKHESAHMLETRQLYCVHMFSSFFLCSRELLKKKKKEATPGSRVVVAFISVVVLSLSLFLVVTLAFFHSLPLGGMPRLGPTNVSSNTRAARCGRGCKARPVGSCNRPRSSCLAGTWYHPRSKGNCAIGTSVVYRSGPCAPSPLGTLGAASPA